MGHPRQYQQDIRDNKPLDQEPTSSLLLCIVGFTAHMLLQPLLFWQTSVRAAAPIPDSLATLLVANAGNIAYPAAIVLFGFAFWLTRNRFRISLPTQLALMLGLFACGATLDLVGKTVAAANALAFLAAGGAFIGAGCGAGIILWQQVLFQQGARRSGLVQATGTSCGGVLYFVVGSLPDAFALISSFLILLPVSALTLAYLLRDQTCPAALTQQRALRELIAYLRRRTSVLICVGGMSFAWGLFYAFSFIFSSSTFLRELFSFGRIIVGLLVLAYVVRFRNAPRTGSLVKGALPACATIALLLPFLSHDYLFVLAGLFYIVFGLLSITLMIDSNRAARDGGIHPILVYCSVLGFFYLTQIVGFLLGQIAVLWVGADSLFTVQWKLAIALLAVYGFSVVGFAFFNRKRPREEESTAAEPTAGQAPPISAPEKALQNEAAAVTAAPPVAPADDDQQQLFEHYDLTEREREIACLMLKGRSVAHISSTLFLSPNTIRYHIKHLYQKTGVHSKQEFIDVFDHA